MIKKQKSKGKEECEESGNRGRGREKRKTTHMYGDPVLSGQIINK